MQEFLGSLIHTVFCIARSLCNPNLNLCLVQLVMVFILILSFLYFTIISDTSYMGWLVKFGHFL